VSTWKPSIEDSIAAMSPAERQIQLRVLAEKGMAVLAVEPYSPTINTEVEEMQETEAKVVQGENICMEPKTEPNSFGRRRSGGMCA
jgi:hypothetical protein